MPLISCPLPRHFLVTRFDQEIEEPQEMELFNAPPERFLIICSRIATYQHMASAFSRLHSAIKMSREFLQSGAGFALHFAALIVLSLQVPLLGAWSLGDMSARQHTASQESLLDFGARVIRRPLAALISQQDAASAIYRATAYSSSPLVYIYILHKEAENGRKRRHSACGI